MSFYLLSLMSVLAVWMAVQDKRSRHVSVWLLTLFLGGSIVYVIAQPTSLLTPLYWWFYSGLVGLFFFSAVYQYCGWGDTILVVGILLWLSETELPFYLILSGLLALGTACYYRLGKQDMVFPLAPALLAAWGVVCWQRIVF